MNRLVMARPKPDAAPSQHQHKTSYQGKDGVRTRHKRDLAGQTPRAGLKFVKRHCNVGGYGRELSIGLSWVSEFSKR